MARMWAEAIFSREAVSLQVASRLCLVDLASMLAVCAATAEVFREAGSLTTKTEQQRETSMMDLVCCALGASKSSGLMHTLEGLVRFPHGRPLLCHAASSGRPDVVRWLLKHWSSELQSADEPCGASPLHFAALGGHGHVCEVLIECGGALVDSRDNSGLRALHLAAEQGHVDACYALLQCGSSPDGAPGLSDLDCGTPTPLLLAAECGHAEVCALLVTFRADPLASSLDGRTPLAVARDNVMAGSELLASLEAALWPSNEATRRAKIASCGLAARHPVLAGPSAQDIIRRTLRQR
ncbi:unnamed protein product [Effrenium voratum]|uniref:Uncharacterized protein n=1 Tax=Effrenium voratum TaxID=2562239 RepID=A0AA36HPE4_9DINO|nr:unnamed protein product [Effrenium voratum]